MRNKTPDAPGLVARIRGLVPDMVPARETWHLTGGVLGTHPNAPGPISGAEPPISRGHIALRVPFLPDWQAYVGSQGSES